MKNHKLIVGIILSLFLSSCGAPIDRVEKILSDSIQKLDNASVDWQETLRITKEELIQAGAPAIADEIEGILSNGIVDLQNSAMCLTDFIRDRMKSDVKRVLYRIMKKKLALIPNICPPAETEINLKKVLAGQQNSIILTGYNLDFADIGVFLVHKNGTKKNVTSKLGKPSNYQYNLNISKNGVQLSQDSEKILIKFGRTEYSYIITSPHVFVPTAPKNSSYSIGLKTGSIKNSGTSAKVQIKLYGSQSISGTYHLRTKGYDDFERGDYKTYKVDVNRDIGEIERVEIWHDNKGDKPGWFLEYITIENLRTKKKKKMTCNKWLATTKGDKQIFRTLYKNGPCK